jgi:hypothetical protein
MWERTVTAMFNEYNTKVTVELREIVESGVNIWGFDYPSFYEGDAKKAFEQKVIDHYYFRQIGQETVGRFLHYFRSKVREIMPYYIQRYKSVELFESIDDPLRSYELTEEYERDTTNTGSTSSSGSTSGEETNNRERKHSDTPQGSITNLETYMSEATKEKETIGTSENSSASSESSDTGKETYKLTRYGNIGVQPLGQELNVLRSSFINVDMEVIDALKDLFLKVY